MTKRPSGSGSIYRLKSGTWRALATKDGQRISYTAKTQKECRDWLEITTGQIRQGLTLASARTTFDQVLENWFTVKENKLRGATRQQYSQIIEKYIKPELGTIATKDLTPARIQDFYSSLQNRGVGARTIEIVHTVLHGCLNHAHRLGLVAQNWAKLVQVPRPAKKEMQIWNETPVSLFLARVPDSAFWRMAFATGMRRGELLGLKWDDLDWQTGSLKVRRQVFQPAGGGWHFQAPKTDRGRRTIRIGPGLVEALRIQFNQTIPTMRAFAGDRWEENDLIFPSTRGTPMDGDNVSKKFQALVHA